MKSLVAYFSASGVTEKVAKRLADAVGADLLEIKPVPLYTKADLDWRNKQSRSSVEMADENCRPPIEGAPDVSGYDTIFVGFPIWWYREPSVVDTFLDACDLTGKKVVPFATSGSSGMGGTAERMRSIVPAATVADGARFPAGVSEKELKAWAEKA
jgi:flavodoxin